jgi:hypothetical protein
MRGDLTWEEANVERNGEDRLAKRAATVTPALQNLSLSENRREVETIETMEETTPPA